MPKVQRWNVNLFFLFPTNFSLLNKTTEQLGNSCVRNDQLNCKTRNFLTIVALFLQQEEIRKRAQKFWRQRLKGGNDGGAGSAKNTTMHLWGQQIFYWSSGLKTCQRKMCKNCMQAFRSETLQCVTFHPEILTYCRVTLFCTKLRANFRQALGRTPPPGWLTPVASWPSPRGWLGVPNDDDTYMTSKGRPRFAALGLKMTAPKMLFFIVIHKSSLRDWVAAERILMRPHETGLLCGTHEHQIFFFLMEVSSNQRAMFRIAHVRVWKTGR